MDPVTEQEFLDIWRNPPAPAPIFYRLYYNNDGSLAFYSMEDLPGNYVEIDHELYQRAPSRIKVVDGKIIEQLWKKSVKLIPSQNGTPCHPEDVTIVVQGPNRTHWTKVYHESN